MVVCGGLDRDVITGIGVARHADAGYETAMETARREGIVIPMAR